MSSPTLICDIADVLPLCVGHVAEVGEDHKPGVEAGHGVHCRCYKTISKAFYNIKLSNYSKEVLGRKGFISYCETCCT